jgi:hypothetical protein
MSSFFLTSVRTRKLLAWVTCRAYYQHMHMYLFGHAAFCKSCRKYVLCTMYIDPFSEYNTTLPCSVADP